MCNLITAHLGNTRLLATSNGSPVQGTTAHYLPYGDYRGAAPTATTLTERGYTGHHENREIGLTYMNARFYSPTTGRFLTTDTIIPDAANPQSHNRYSYVLGNTLRYTDPTGHLSEDEIEKYFGFTTKQQMIDAYGKAVADILWNTEISWGDVLSYSCDECNGGRGYVMLLLKQVSANTEKFRGAFWGIEATHYGLDHRGIEVSMGVIKPEFIEKSISKTEYYKNNYGNIPINKNAYGMGHQGNDMLAGSWYDVAFFRPLAFLASLKFGGKGWAAYDIVTEIMDDVSPVGHPLGDYLTVYPTIRSVSSLHPHSPNTYTFLSPRGVR